MSDGRATQGWQAKGWAVIAFRTRRLCILTDMADPEVRRDPFNASTEIDGNQASSLGCELQTTNARGDSRPKRPTPASNRWKHSGRLEAKAKMSYFQDARSRSSARSGQFAAHRFDGSWVKGKTSRESRLAKRARRFGRSLCKDARILVRWSGKEWNFENPSTASFGACGFLTE